MSTATCNPQIDIRLLQDYKNSSYTTGLKRAATITVTGHRIPRKSSGPRMPRPVSMLLDREAANYPTIMQPISYFNEQDFMPRKLHVKDDPFVSDNSDGSDSVRSSENDTTAESSVREEVTPLQDVAPSSREAQPVVSATGVEPGQESGVDRLGAQTGDAVSDLSDARSVNAHWNARDAIVGGRHDENNYETSPRLPRTPRARPASVAIMTTPRTRSPTSSSKRRSVQFSDISTTDFRTGSPIRQVSFPTTSSPLANTPVHEDSQTPNSRMRRLSRRISITPQGSSTRDISPTPTRSNRRSVTLPTSFIVEPSTIHNIPSTLVAPLPSFDQMASLDRRDSQRINNITRTPPRARNMSTTPRAASGARRTSASQSHDAGRFGRIIEDDGVLEEESANYMVPLRANMQAPERSATADTEPLRKHVLPPEPTSRAPDASPTKPERQKSAYKRLSYIGSRLSPSVKQSDLQTPLYVPAQVAVDQERAKKEKGKGCTVM